jgi:hypothetical protein
LFDLVVAENGAVLCDPQRCEDIALAEPLPAQLTAGLHERGVSPLEIGRVLVATTDSHRVAVLEVIRAQHARTLFLHLDLKST